MAVIDLSFQAFSCTLQTQTNSCRKLKRPDIHCYQNYVANDFDFRLHIYRHIILYKLVPVALLCPSARASQCDEFLCQTIFEKALFFSSFDLKRSKISTLCCVFLFWKSINTHAVLEFFVWANFINRLKIYFLPLLPRSTLFCWNLDQNLLDSPIFGFSNEVELRFLVSSVCYWLSSTQYFVPVTFLINVGETKLTIGSWVYRYDACM